MITMNESSRGTLNCPECPFGCTAAIDLYAHLGCAHVVAFNRIVRNRRLEESIPGLNPVIVNASYDAHPTNVVDQGNSQHANNPELVMANDALEADSTRNHSGIDGRIRDTLDPNIESVSSNLQRNLQLQPKATLSSAFETISSSEDESDENGKLHIIEDDLIIVDDTDGCADLRKQNYSITEKSPVEDRNSFMEGISSRSEARSRSRSKLHSRSSSRSKSRSRSNSRSKSRWHSRSRPRSLSRSRSWSNSRSESGFQSKYSPESRCRRKPRENNKFRENERGNYDRRDPALFNQRSENRIWLPYTFKGAVLIDSNSRTKVNCLICSLEFDDIKAAFEHDFEFHSIRRYPCGIEHCCFIAQSEEELTLHLIQEQQNQGVVEVHLKCKFCRRRLTDIQEFANHVFHDYGKFRRFHYQQMALQSMVLCCKSCQTQMKGAEWFDHWNKCHTKERNDDIENWLCFSRDLCSHRTTACKYFPSCGRVCCYGHPVCAHYPNCWSYQNSYCKFDHKPKDRRCRTVLENVSK